MTLGVRRIITIIFITLFLIFAPLLILYTAGYRYNFAKNKIEKTGLIILSVQGQKDFSILLNDAPAKKIFRDNKVIRIRGLLPNTYNVKIQKEGFHSWEKDLEVKSKLTTFASDVKLFKKNIPGQLINQKIKAFLPSNDKTKISYLTESQIGQEIWISDLKKETKTLLYRFSQNDKNIEIITWGPKNEKILIKSNNDFFVLDYSNPQDITSFKKYSKNFKNISWHKYDNNILYALEKNDLYRINLQNKKPKKLFKIDSDKYIIKENNVYYVTPDSDKSNLIIKNFNSDKELIIASELPILENYLFIEDNSNEFITILDNQRKELYIINPAAKNDILKLQAKDAAWQGKRLLYYNDFEIWFYDLEKNQKELIRRQSNPIKKAILYPDLEHIIYLDNNIYITETDAQTKNNIELVSQFDNIEEIICDQYGEKIYFSGTLNSKSGLYELDIFEK